MALDLGLHLGLGMGTSAVYTPASESGLVGWYDFSDLAHLWQDTAGTSAVTADGQSIARIDDKSGNNNHLTQGTAANRPLYKTSGGLHWGLFDGSNDALAASIAQSQAFTLFVACRENAYVDGLGIIEGDFGSFSPGGGSGNVKLFAGTAHDPIVANAGYGTDVVYRCVFNGASSSISKDGGAATTGNPGSTAMTTFSIGRTDMRVHQVALFSGTKTSAQLLTYFAEKQGRVL